jgi:hypothetical protein
MEKLVVQSGALETIIQGGAITLCFYLIFCGRKSEAEKNKLYGNHMNHNTEALNQVQIALTKLVTFLENKE